MALTTGNSTITKTAICGAIIFGLMASTVSASAPAGAAMSVASESVERPGLSQEDRVRAEARAEEAREDCKTKNTDDRIAYTNCIATARASAYREQAKVERR